jgi:hypothetical protein
VVRSGFGNYFVPGSFILALWRMVEEGAGNVSVSKGMIIREAERNV